MLFLLDWAPHIFPFKALLNPLISLVALLWILQFTSFWEMSFPQPPATAELIHAGITLTVLAVPPEWTCIFQNIIYQYFKSFQVSLLSHENLLCAAMRDIPIFGHTETQAYTHIHVHFKLISFFDYLHLSDFLLAKHSSLMLWMAKSLFFNWQRFCFFNNSWQNL